MSDEAPETGTPSRPQAHEEGHEERLTNYLHGHLTSAPEGAVLQYEVRPGERRERQKGDDGRWRMGDGPGAASAYALAANAARGEWALWHSPADQPHLITLLATNQTSASEPEMLRLPTKQEAAPRAFRAGDRVKVGPNPKRHRNVGGALIPSVLREGEVGKVIRVFSDGDLDMERGGVVRSEDVTLVAVDTDHEVPEAPKTDILDRTAEALHLHPHREPTGVTLALNLIAQAGVPEHLMLDALDQAIWLSRRTGMTLRTAIEMNQKARVIHQATEREQ